MDVEPFGGSFFAAAYLIANSSIENLRATAGDGAQPNRAQIFQCIADRHPKNSLSQMADFDRSKSLDVKFWIESTQSLQKFQVPFLLKRRVQSTYHVHLRNSEGKRVSYDLRNFVDRIFKRVRIAFFGGKGAELA